MISRSVCIVLVLVIFITSKVTGQEDVDLDLDYDDEDDDMKQKELLNMIEAILEHYKQEDPVGIPGAPIAEPLKIPPLTQSFSFVKMNFRDVELYGLSKFRIDHIESDLAAMQVKAGLRIDVLDVNGTYTLSQLWSKSTGPFTVKLSNVYVQGVAVLEVEKTGQLQAQEIKMDITFENIAMNFENLGYMGSIFQGILNSVGSFLFDSIKPFILSEVNNNIRGDMNKHISKLPQRFPNSISPFDQLIAEGRKQVRQNKYDPYYIPDYNHTFGIFSVHLSHTWLTGLSSFYRVGNMTVEVRNNTLHVGIHMGTQKLSGSGHWEVSVAGGMMSRSGTVKFTVDYFNVEMLFTQSLDTRNHPVLDDIQLELGNIQVRCDGAGTIDYIIEFAINILPNLLRYQIMDALETPLQTRIQEKLNQVNFERLIKTELPIILEKNEFKL